MEGLFNVASKEKNPLWLCDHLQFVRMLAEIHAAGIPTPLCKDLRKSMDLNQGEVLEIFERATAEWDDIKITAPKSFNPQHHTLFLESKWVLINHEAYKAVQHENCEVNDNSRGLVKIIEDLKEALRPYYES